MTDEPRPGIASLADAIGKRVIGEVSLLTLLFSMALLGILSVFMRIQQAAPVALAVFGIMGGAETVYRKAKARFLQKDASLKRCMGRNTETFLQLADKVYGVKKWSPETKDIRVDGVIFRLVACNRPLPMSALAGPLCPECGKNLHVRPLPWAPWLCRMTCLCGFSKTGSKHPEDTFCEVRSHLNIPEE